jgi:hypothetical protein
MGVKQLERDQIHPVPSAIECVELSFCALICPYGVGQSLGQFCNIITLCGMMTLFISFVVKECVTQGSSYESHFC